MTTLRVMLTDGTTDQQMVALERAVQLVRSGDVWTGSERNLIVDGVVVGVVGRYENNQMALGAYREPKGGTS